MDYTVKHKWVIPESIVRSCLKEINSNKLTIGVHKEDNDKHENRDMLGLEPAHSARYPYKPIGNAELLKKNEKLHREVVYGEDGETDTITIPARPVLAPTVKMCWDEDKFLITNGIEKQLQFKSSAEVRNGLTNFAKSFNESHYPLQFIMAEGAGYWDDDSKSNSIYTQLIKFLDNTRAYGAVFDDVFNENGTFKKGALDGFVIPSGYDTPLLDSTDMVNSIKAKVEKR